MVYVSITGLRIKSPLQLPIFAWHAVRSMRQAKMAPGNLAADARRIEGIHHTLTLWQDRSAMLAYLRSGAHLKAMKAFPAIGTGYAFGFDTQAAPAWPEVHALWRAEGERRSAAAARGFGG
jgi:hypothetical protein